ncbi:hypothetical protein D9M69_712010 [compost metagenome]
MYFNDPALEHILSAKLLKHLGLGGMHHIPEIHVFFHLAFKGYLHRFRDRHGGFTCSKGKGNRTRVCPESHAF